MLEKDFILSKTEFVAYLKCPFQFYLLKELYKPTGHKRGNNYSDYEQFLFEGLQNHLWLQNFYQKYSAEILDNTHPLLTESDKNNSWKRAFIDFEVNRFRLELDFWEPVAVELYLRNDSLCGTIDRIDLLNAKGDCRIVEYKPYSSKYDEEELLFYAVLLTNHLPYEELPTIAKVTELGIYYYKAKEYYKAQLTAEIIDSFAEYLKSLKIEMVFPYSIKKKKTCDFSLAKCLYRETCQRIHIRRQKIIGLSKI